jgi:hypothetical protein
MSFADTGTLGIFEYEHDSFTISLKSGKRKIIWKEIERLEAYKRDLLTIDQVCLDFVLAQTVITISEDSEGFRPFINKLQEQFPAIEKDWDWEITQPPFATNFMVLYERK